METCWESLKQELEENSNYFKGLLSGSLLLQETSTDDKYDDQNCQISSSEILLHKVWHLRWSYISIIKLPNYYWEEVSPPHQGPARNPGLSMDRFGRECNTNQSSQFALVDA